MKRETMHNDDTCGLLLLDEHPNNLGTDVQEENGGDEGQGQDNDNERIPDEDQCVREAEK